MSHKPDCVCTLCTCGRHQCNPPATPFQGQSTHQADYTRHAIPRGFSAPGRKSSGDGQGNKDSGSFGQIPFNGQTTHQADFIPYAVSGKTPIRAPSPAIATSGPFRDQTTHRADYGPKHLNNNWVKSPTPIGKIPSVPTQTPAGPGHYLTTQRSSYTPKSAPKSSAPPALNVHTTDRIRDHFPTTPIYPLQTTQRADYTPKSLPRASSVGASPNALYKAVPDDPRRFQTTNHSDYVNFGPAQRAAPCPVLSLDAPTRLTLSHYRPKP